MSLAPERHIKVAGATKNIAVSFVGELDSGELLTGTPTVSEFTKTSFNAAPEDDTSSSDLTITNIAVSTVELTINKRTVAIGLAVQMKIVGGTAGVIYRIRITTLSDASPAQIPIGDIIMSVEA